MYEVFDHTADLGLRIRTATREELFVDAARALFSLIVTNLDAVAGVEERTYVLREDQPDLLLFDWLSELLYTFESEHLLLSEFEVQLAGNTLRATGRGEFVDSQRHRLEHEVKAITYHGLRLEPQADGWLAEVIVDI